MEYIWKILRANFRRNRSRDTGFQAKKTDMSIDGLNRSSSKTNCRRIKVSDLKAPGNVVSALTFKLFLFLFFFFYVKLSYMYKNPKPLKLET